MSAVATQAFYHRFRWKDSTYSDLPLFMRDYTASKVAALTGKNFFYQAIQKFADRRSQAKYQRSDAQIMAIDPVTLSFVVTAIASALSMIIQAIKGKPVEVGIDSHTKNWYINTGDHEAVGDGNKSIPVGDGSGGGGGGGVGGGGGGSGGDSSNTQSTDSMLLIGAAIAGLAILFILTK